MAIDDAFLTHVNWAKLSGVSKEGLKAGEMKVETAAFPHPPYAFKSVSHYTTVLAVLLPSSIIIGFACMASITIAILVDERNNGVQVSYQFETFRYGLEKLTVIQWIVYYRNSSQCSDSIALGIG